MVNVTEHSILVVGDWTVDEYWLLVKHKSPTSAHIGRNHYRVNGQDIDLCGAAYVTHVLYQEFSENTGKITINGMGVWSEKDSETIKTLVRTQNKDRRDRVDFGQSLCANQQYNKKNQKTVESQKETNVHLNLISLLQNGKTHRAIRQYVRDKTGGLEQINRIDWNTEVEPLKTIPELSEKQKNTTSIVILDLIKGDKGVVTDKIIALLNKKYSEANWYIRSKELSPAWLKIIANGTIKLLLVGPELTEQIALGESILVGKKKIIPQIQVEMEMIGRDIKPENLVFVSNRREFIALVKKEKGEKEGESESEYFTAALTAATYPGFLYLGWTNAIFASLIHEMHSNNKNKMTKIEINNAFINTYKYIRTPFSSDVVPPPAFTIEEARKWSDAKKRHNKKR